MTAGRFVGATAGTPGLLARHGFEAMASPCGIVVAGSPERVARSAIVAAEAEVRRIEQKFSRYRADTIVGRINAQAGGTPVACDAETLHLIGYADTLYRASEGLFDVTSGILRRAWDFRKAVLPTPQQLEPLLALVGWDQVERDGHRLRLPRAGMEVDFGGFGKEYAADRAAGVLIEKGIRHAIVNLGGDVRCVGTQPDGSPWQIGIQNPRDPNSNIASIPLSHGGIATSGDSERYFDLDGVRYCHILNPQTGMPVRYWRSVSIAAPLAIAAGSYSTIAMLMEERAKEWLDSSGLGYLLVGPDGAITKRDAPSA